MLPPQIAAELMSGTSTLAKVISNSGVLFTDLVGFTKLSGSIPSQKLFKILNYMYAAFDRHIDHYNVYKVDTIGDAFIVTGTIKNLTDFALALQDEVKLFNKTIASETASDPSSSPMDQLAMRCGIHVGDILCGVVGATRPRFQVMS